MSEPETPWLTIDQAAARLQCSVRTVERMVAAGRLTEHKYERTRRYHVEDVDAALLPTGTLSDPATCSKCLQLLEHHHGGDCPPPL